MAKTNLTDIKTLRIRAKRLGYKLVKRGDYRLLHKDGSGHGGLEDLNQISKLLDDLALIESGKAEFVMFSACGMPLNDAAQRTVVAGYTADDICRLGRK